MTSESAFLNAIASEPKGSPRRLIYADWLEEKGDPRAELIRLEEEMRTLAVSSDRYWELKPRRNELRKEADSKWLKVMRFGTDYEPVFAHGWPDCWKERWRVIWEYVERWWGLPPLNEEEKREETLRPEQRAPWWLPRRSARQLCDGFQRNEEKELAESQVIEAELGVPLPPAFREWIFYRRYVFKEAFAPHAWHETNEGCKYLYLAGDEDFWGILEEHIAFDDPLVSHFQDDWGDGGVAAFPVGKPIPLTQWELRNLFWLNRAPTQIATLRCFPERVGVLKQIKQTFPVLCQMQELEVFERENIQVVLGHWGRNSATFELVRFWNGCPNDAPSYLQLLWGDQCDREQFADQEFDEFGPGDPIPF